MQGFTADLTDNPTWMVDPVDGTTNFVHRFPFVCVCIGLAIDKKVPSSPVEMSVAVDSPVKWVLGGPFG